LRQNRLRALDLLGQTDLLLPSQQRDRAHLGQVHSDRVVDPPRDLVEVLGSQFAIVLVPRFSDALVGLVVEVPRGQQARFGLILVDQLDAHLILVDQLDAHLAERFEQIGDLGVTPPMVKNCTLRAAGDGFGW
jgi:hypothetical protein